MKVREFRAAIRCMRVPGVSWTSLLGVLSAICSTLAAVFYMHVHTVNAVPGRTAADYGHKSPIHRDGKSPLWDDRLQAGGNGLTKYPATGVRRFYNATFHLMRMLQTRPLQSACEVLLEDNTESQAFRTSCESQCWTSRADYQFKINKYVDDRVTAASGCIQSGVGHFESFSEASIDNLPGLCIVKCTCKVSFTIPNIWMPRAETKGGQSYELSPKLSLSTWRQEEDFRGKIRPAGCHPEQVLTSLPLSSNSFGSQWLVEPHGWDINYEHIPCKCLANRIKCDCSASRKVHPARSACPPSAWRYRSSSDEQRQRQDVGNRYAISNQTVVDALCPADDKMDGPECYFLSTEEVGACNGYLENSPLSPGQQSSKSICPSTNKSGADDEPDDPGEIMSQTEIDACTDYLKDSSPFPGQSSCRDICPSTSHSGADDKSDDPEEVLSKTEIDACIDYMNDCPPSPGQSSGKHICPSTSQLDARPQPTTGMDICLPNEVLQLAANLDFWPDWAHCGYL